MEIGLIHLIIVAVNNQKGCIVTIDHFLDLSCEEVALIYALSLLQFMAWQWHELAVIVIIFFQTKAL